MTPLVLVHALVVADPTPPACPQEDPGCQAERFAALAAKSATHADRVLRLFAAHRSYFDLYGRTHDESALCKARETLDRAASLTPTPAHLVSAIEDAGRKTREREQAASVDCKARAKKSAAATKTRKTTHAVAESQEPKSSPRSPAEDDPPPLLTTTSTTSSAPPPPPSSPSEVSPPPVAPVPQVSTLTPPPSRDRVRLPPARIAGGVILLAASAGFAVGTWASLDARGEVVRRYEALEAAITEAGREPNADELTQRDRLDRQYGQLSFAAGLTGAAATAGVIAGVVLLATPPKKQRMSAAPWAGPRAAGLTIRGHF